MIGNIALVAIIGLVGIGMYALLITRNLIKIVVALQIMVKGAMIAMIVAGQVSGKMVLGESLALTVIVADTIVAVVAMSLCVQVRRRFGTLDVKALSTLRR